MAYKIFFVMALSVMFAAGNVCLAANGVGNGQAQNQAQQEQDDSVEAQESEKISEGVRNEIKNQNQVQNEGEETQIRTTEQQEEQESENVAKDTEEDEGKGGDQVSEQRRSNVATAVQEMLKVADRNDGIGEQVRVIAQEQNQKHEKIEESLKKVQGRSRLVKFLIGSDLGEIQNAEQTMAQVEDQVQQLRQLKDGLKLKTDQQTIDEQLQLLEQTQSQIKNLLEESKGGFSLLGWALKLFRR